MKKGNFTLNIDTPCQQEWSSMTKTDEGKYCSKCAKNVVDFTGLSDAEIIRLIEQAPGPLCGNLNAYQLNRIYYSGQPSSQSSFYKYFAGLLLVGVTGSSLAKENNRWQTELISQADSLGEGPQDQVQAEDILTKSLPVVAHGIIIEANTKQTVAFANIEMKDSKTGVGTMADLDGNFSMNIPDSLITDNMILVVSSVGYKKAELYVTREDLKSSLEIVVYRGVEITGAGDIVFELRGLIDVGSIPAKSQHKWWQFWK